MLVTALVTPFSGPDASLDLSSLRRLAAFQIEQGVDQVLLGGTTGEIGSLTDAEYFTLLREAREVLPGWRVVAGLGSGRLDQIIARGRFALELGIHDLLLVDCPYSGASSASLRTHWYGPVAEALPEARLMPYAIPSRTGTELLPDDLARLAEDHDNVVGVKDATGRLARMERVRALCGPDFVLLCGDDFHARSAMLDPVIAAQGCCSVVSNLVPAAMVALVRAAGAGDASGARLIHDGLERLFRLSTLTIDEAVEVGDEVLMVPQRARNPVPMKHALREMGVLNGGCRAPLGGLGRRGRSAVRDLLLDALLQDPALFAPLEQFFEMDAMAVLHGGGELVV
jgi:4-hydroxy-tetrahydrodipicolinate synthase